MSLNTYCVEALASSSAVGLGEHLRRCVDAFGMAVDGVVLFGSVARGEAMDTSDADVLIVLRPGSRIVRGLYSRWDAIDGGKAEIEGFPVNPLFAVRPMEGEDVGSLWYEVARDGVVLWERGTVVRRTLVRLRQQILDGVVERRGEGSQAYWFHRGGADA